MPEAIKPTTRTVTAQFVKREDKKHSVRFDEVPAADGTQILKSAYVSKQVCGNAAGFRATLEFPA